MSANTPVPTSSAEARRYLGGLLEYDTRRRRVWVAGQRLHHGLTGAVLTGAGIAGLAARRIRPKGTAEVALFGSVLMVHDWHDRTHWFEPGHQSDD